MFCMKSKTTLPTRCAVSCCCTCVYQAVALALPETDDDDTGEFKELVYNSIQEVWLESRLTRDKAFSFLFSFFLFLCSCCNEQIWTPVVIAVSCVSNHFCMNSSIFCVGVKIVPKPETARCWEHCWYAGIDLIKWKLHCCSLSVRKAVYIACTLWRRAVQSRHGRGLGREEGAGNSFQ